MHAACVGFPTQTCLQSTFLPFPEIVLYSSSYLSYRSYLSYSPKKKFEIPPQKPLCSL